MNRVEGSEVISSVLVDIFVVLCELLILNDQC